MSNRVRLSMEEKLAAVKDIVEGRESVGRVARNIGASKWFIKGWLREYDESGIEGLKESHTWKRYSAQRKDQAVQNYLVKWLSGRQIVKKYGIFNHSVLMDWVSKYTGGKKLKSTRKGTSTKMNEGQKNSV